MPTDQRDMDGLQAVNMGLEAAAAEEMGPDRAKEYGEEKAQVKWWLSTIQASRDFDDAVWRQMAMDRRYAAGYSEFEVSTNLIGSAIDVMKSFLYAKDPDLAITPAASVMTPKPVKPTPPPPLPPAIQQAMADPLAAGQQLGETLGPALPQLLEAARPMIDNFQAQQARYQQEEQMYRAAVEQRRAEREQRRKFAESLQIAASKAWKSGKLKVGMKAVVGSGLTVGIGWLKASWREDRGLDPISQQRVNSITDNLARIERLREQMRDPAGADDLERLRQQLTEELVGLNSKTEAIISRGMTLDHVCSEDLTFPIGVTNVANPTDSPWIDHRLFIKYDDAKAEFSELDETKLKKATRYSQIRPVAPAGEAQPMWSESTNWKPGQFESGDSDFGNRANGTNTFPDCNGDFVCVHETWDRTANMIRTTIEGVECYVKPPHAPEIATTRFYPFFAVAFTEVDGQRYPQSLVYRSYKLADEYNRTRSAWAQARRRSKAGVLFDASAVDKDTATRLTDGAETGEWTAIHGVAGKDFKTAFIPKPTTQINPALYDTGPIRRDFEDIWGIQQALSGGVTVEKTATEAEIQQQGFGARTGYMRDAVEVMLNELAGYTAEILLQRLTPDDARLICGQGAVWPESFSVDDLETLVDVKIEAGTTGKPNTAAQRAAWATTLPLLQALVEKVGMMRGASADDIADNLENLVAITLRRGGDEAIDIESLVPQEGGGESLVPQGMGVPGAPASPGMAMPEPQPPGDVSVAPEMAM